MGALARFDLRKIKKEFDISHLIETGTWYGDSCNYAIDKGFSVESCEINEKFIMIARDRFKDRSNVRIYQMASEKFLPIADEQQPSLFFLDAHLPEIYSNHESGDKFSDRVAYPLEFELQLVLRKQNFEKSIIIVDDLRLYDSNLDYDAGKIEPLGFNVINWFDRNTRETHSLQISSADEGYLIAQPRIKNRIDLGFEMSVMNI